MYQQGSREDYESHTGAYSIERKRSHLFLISLLSTVTIAVFLLYNGGSQNIRTGSNNLSKLFKSSDESDYSSSIKFPNFSLKRVGYDALPYFNSKISNVIAKYKFLDSYDAIIEPYVNMELHFYDSDALKSSTKFIYKICTSGKQSTICKESIFYTSSNSDKVSGSVKFDCDAYDTFDIVVYEVDYSNNDNLLRQTSGKAVCLQIRREVRSLSEEDLSRFIDVSYALWNTSEAEGLQKYGSTFHNAAYLLKLHHFNAAQQDADHIHEGNGFLLQHAKITNIFEDSLKAIDPSIFLPYWDYTIDDSNKHSVVDSVVMTAKLYGRMFMPKDIEKGFQYKDDKIADGRIIDGAWANLKADFNTEFPDLKTGYGYMRAPWSMNPSPYISRFTTVYDRTIMLPSCQMHYDVLVNYKSMMEFFYQIAYFPHATVHTLAGGIYGCDQLMTLYQKGYINSEMGVNNICKGWIFVLKELYRHNLIAPRKNCEVNENDLESSACGFDCTDGHLLMVQKALLIAVSKDANINQPNAGAVWSDFLCNGGPGGKIFPGDHLESASPTDPSFWVVHPTIERLLHFKLLSGGFPNEKWYTDPVKEEVCEKPSCFNSTFGRSDYFSHCCYGHFEHDRMLDFESGDRNKFIGLSNAEILNAGDPRSESYSLPYVYDGFSWEHCEQNFQGIFTGDISTDTNAENINGSPVKTDSGGPPLSPP